MNTPPESTLGTAIELLRTGIRLPTRLINELNEQGYDVVGLHTAYLNKKA